jgi:hypothetical protein
MSSWLSTNTRIEYTPVLYDGQDVLIKEGNGYDYEEEAEDKASDMVARYVSEHDKYCYCVIQKRVVPILET